VDYYQLKNSDKTVLGSDQYGVVMEIVEKLKTNPYVKHYFIEPYPEGWEVKYQVPIYFTYDKVECKALLDLLVIDHKNKKIIPVDLKTTAKLSSEFPRSYLQFGYYRQCAFYETALLSEESPVKEHLDAGYKLEDFRFIVVETKKGSTNPPLVFITSKSDRISGMQGGTVGSKYYKGIDELIAAYLWHQENDYWEMSLTDVSNECHYPMNVFSS
jgi:hypothetical protein